jgi:hypothetical protein
MADRASAPVTQSWGAPAAWIDIDGVSWAVGSGG